MMDERKILLFLQLIIALGMGVVGASVFLDPVFVTRNYGVRVNFGVHHELIGIAIAACGVLLIYFSLRSYANREK